MEDEWLSTSGKVEDWKAHKGEWGYNPVYDSSGRKYTSLKKIVADLDKEKEMEEMWGEPKFDAVGVGVKSRWGERENPSSHNIILLAGGIAIAAMGLYAISSNSNYPYIKENGIRFRRFWRGKTHKSLSGKWGNIRLW